MSADRRVSEHKITFIVAERDIDSPFRATGAIIFEQFTKDTPLTVLERARGIARNSRYGRLWIGQIDEADLVPLEDFRYDVDDDDNAPDLPEGM